MRNIHFGVPRIDKLDLYISLGESNISFNPVNHRLFSLSANSDVIVLDDHTTLYYDYHLSSRNKCRYYVIRDNLTNNIIAFLLTNFRENGATKRRNLFETTGIGMAIRSIDWFLETLQNLYIDIQEIKRLDVSCDFNVPTNDFIYDIYPILSDTTNTPFKTKENGFETLNLGHKTTSKNTYKFTRIYNKVLDTFAKGKNGLYQFDPLDQVTRLEIEFRRDKLKGFNRDKSLSIASLLSDQEKIKILFFQEITKTLKTNKQPEKILKDYSEIFDISHYKSEKILPPIDSDFSTYDIKYDTFFKSLKLEKQAISTMFTIIEKLIASGTDPHDLTYQINDFANHTRRKYFPPSDLD